MKKKPNKYAYIYLFLGLVIGISLICIGVVKSKQYNKKFDSDRVKNEERLKEVKSEIINVQTEQNEEFRKNGFSKRYNELASEYKDLVEERNQLEISTKKSNVGLSKNLLFFIFGAVVVVMGIIISSFIYLTTTLPSDLGSGFSKLAKEMDDKREKEYVSLKCPNCGNTNLKGNDEEICEYCGSLLRKVNKR